MTSERPLVTAIYRLRKKLAGDDERVQIQSRRGKGYLFVCTDAVDLAEK